MKYIKEYSNYNNESKNYIYDDIKENLNGILLEASDLGYKTKLSLINDKINISIYVDTGGPLSSHRKPPELDTSSVDDCFKRIIDYAKQTKIFHNPSAKIFYYDETGSYLIGYDLRSDDLRKITDNINFSLDFIKEKDFVRNVDFKSSVSVYGVELEFRLKYHLYESNQYKNYIYDDIREIFSELTDYKCDLSINKINNKHVIILSNKNDIIDYFKLSDIKDELLRLKDYLGDKWIGCGIVFAGDVERTPVYINEDNYDNLDNFSEISNLSVIFNI
jgi:hypothetical protein